MVVDRQARRGLPRESSGAFGRSPRRSRSVSLKTWNWLVDLLERQDLAVVEPGDLLLAADRAVEEPVGRVGDPVGRPLLGGEGPRQRPLGEAPEPDRRVVAAAGDDPLPSGQAIRALTCSACCGMGSSRSRWRGRSMPQSQTDLSAPAAASHWPSGVNATARTARSRLPRSSGLRLAVLPQEDLAVDRPSDDPEGVERRDRGGGDRDRLAGASSRSWRYVARTASIRCGPRRSQSFAVPSSLAVSKRVAHPSEKRDRGDRVRVACPRIVLDELAGPGLPDAGERSLDAPAPRPIGHRERPPAGRSAARSTPSAVLGRSNAVARPRPVARSTTTTSPVSSDGQIDASRRRARARPRSIARRASSVLGHPGGPRPALAGPG